MPLIPFGSTNVTDESLHPSPPFLVIPDPDVDWLVVLSEHAISIRSASTLTQLAALYLGPDLGSDILVGGIVRPSTVPGRVLLLTARGALILLAIDLSPSVPAPLRISAAASIDLPVRDAPFVSLLPSRIAQTAAATAAATAVSAAATAISASGAAVSVSVSADGARILAAAAPSLFQRPVAWLVRPEPSDPFVFAAHPDGTPTAAARLLADNPSGPRDQDRPPFWPTEAGWPTRVLPTPAVRAVASALSRACVTALHFCAAASLLAVGTSDGRVVILRLLPPPARATGVANAAAQPAAPASCTVHAVFAGPATGDAVTTLRWLPPAGAGPGQAGADTPAADASGCASGPRGAVLAVGRASGAVDLMDASGHGAGTLLAPPPPRGADSARAPHPHPLDRAVTELVWERGGASLLVWRASARGPPTLARTRFATPCPAKTASPHGCPAIWAVAPAVPAPPTAAANAATAAPAVVVRFGARGDGGPGGLVEPVNRCFALPDDVREVLTVLPSPVGDAALVLARSASHTGPTDGADVCYLVSAVAPAVVCLRRAASDAAAGSGTGSASPPLPFAAAAWVGPDRVSLLRQPRRAPRPAAAAVVAAVEVVHAPRGGWLPQRRVIAAAAVPLPAAAWPVRGIAAVPCTDDHSGGASHRARPPPPSQQRRRRLLLLLGSGGAVGVLPLPPLFADRRERESGDRQAGGAAAGRPPLQTSAAQSDGAGSNGGKSGDGRSGDGRAPTQSWPQSTAGATRTPRAPVPAAWLRLDAVVPGLAAAATTDSRRVVVLPVPPTRTESADRPAPAVRVAVAQGPVCAVVDLHVGGGTGEGRPLRLEMARTAWLAAEDAALAVAGIAPAADGSLWGLGGGAATRLWAPGMGRGSGHLPGPVRAPTGLGAGFAWARPGDVCLCVSWPTTSGADAGPEAQVDAFGPCLRAVPVLARVLLAQCAAAQTGAGSDVGDGAHAPHALHALRASPWAALHVELATAAAAAARPGSHAAAALPALRRIALDLPSALAGFVRAVRRADLAHWPRLLAAPSTARTLHARALAFGQLDTGAALVPVILGDAQPRTARAVRPAWVAEATTEQLRAAARAGRLCQLAHLVRFLHRVSEAEALDRAGPGGAVEGEGAVRAETKGGGAATATAAGAGGRESTGAEGGRGSAVRPEKQDGQPAARREGWLAWLGVV